jgi:sugar lactone lactonase YvrE
MRLCKHPLLAFAMVITPLALMPSALAAKDNPLELVKNLEGFGLIAVAVTPEGRIFASAPAATSGNHVIEIDPATGAIRPYPDALWQATGEVPHWFAPQALWIDEQGTLWVLDSGRPTLPTSAPTGPAKLVAFDLATNTITHSYTFEGAVSDEDSLNDLRVDHARGYVYLTNINRQGSLVVMNLKTGKARQVLVGDRSTHADPAEHLRLGDQIGLLRSGKPPLVHADGIAMSPDGRWLIYRTLTDHNYWRVPIDALVDEKLSAAQLAQRVQFLGKGPITGGIIAAPDGTLYGGDLEHGGVVAMHPDLKAGTLQARTLPQSAAIAWGDGFSIAGGYLYVADARLSEKVFANSLPKRGPVAIYRIRLKGSPKAGH